MKTRLATLIILLMMAAGARAQYGSGEYTNPHTGTTWNNPTSSFLDTVIRNNQEMSSLMVRQSIERSSLQQALAREREEQHLYWWGAVGGLVYCVLRLRRQPRPA